MKKYEEIASFDTTASMSSPYKFRWAITRTIPPYLIFLLITSPVVIPLRNVVINVRREKAEKHKEARPLQSRNFLSVLFSYSQGDHPLTRNATCYHTKVSYRKYNDFEDFSFLWKNHLELGERILKCNTVEARYLICRSTHMHMHIQYISLSASSRRFTSRNIYERNFPNYHHCDKARCANGQARPVFFHLVGHSFRSGVHRAINSTNAKCGKLMSAASTWTRELRLACVIPLNYSRNPVSSSSPIQTRFGPGTTPYTLSVIKIKCLYKVNRHMRKTALTRFAENVNWFGRNN